MDTMTPTVDEASPRVAIVRRWQVSSPKEENSHSAKVVTRWNSFVRKTLHIFAVGREWAAKGRYLQEFSGLKKVKRDKFSTLRGASG